MSLLVTLYNVANDGGDWPPRRQLERASAMKKMYRVVVERNDNERDGWNFETLEEARRCYDGQDVSTMYYTEADVQGSAVLKAAAMRDNTYAKSIIPVVVDEFGDWMFDEDSDEQFDLPCESFGYEDHEKIEEAEYEAWKRPDEE